MSDTKKTPVVALQWDAYDANPLGNSPASRCADGDGLYSVQTWDGVMSTWDFENDREGTIPAAGNYLATEWAGLGARLSDDIAEALAQAEQHMRTHCFGLYVHLRKFYPNNGA